MTDEVRREGLILLTGPEMKVYTYGLSDTCNCNLRLLFLSFFANMTMSRDAFVTQATFDWNEGFCSATALYEVKCERLASDEEGGRDRQQGKGRKERTSESQWGSFNAFTTCSMPEVDLF